MSKPGIFRKQAVFGAADGVSAVIGLVALIGQPHALFKAALGVALAELVGMTAGAWLSADEDSSFLEALANGAAAFACVLAPAVPYLFTSGTAALVIALGVIVAIGGTISMLRTERGLAAAGKTYGVLAVAAVVCVAAAFI